MKNLIAAVTALFFALCAAQGFAGVAPNTGSSAAQQSGAKVAPAKPATEEKKEHQEEAKDPAK